jgi:hypothetical protein
MTFQKVCSALPAQVALQNITYCVHFVCIVGSKTPVCLFCVCIIQDTCVASAKLNFYTSEDIEFICIFTNT